MKCMIPEISWHNREPVLSIDIQPLDNDFYRLATGGSDCQVLVWHAKIAESGAVGLDIVSTLTKHQRSVNVVRWSPTGQYLASADDDANIIIWNLKTDNIPMLDGDSNDKEIWIITKILRGHKDDIYDLCWSPSGSRLLSGSIDNTAIIWDFAQGKLKNILTDHKGFVQGVCWDPRDEYMATLTSDRTCRIFEKDGKHVRARLCRGTLPVPESHPLYEKEVKYFHDDTFKSYFRRLTFTPDGNLLVAPSGSVETEDTKKALCGTYLFTLDNLTQPVAILPLQKQCSIAVRCCPVLYELRPGGPEPLIDLPYRMIIAVATESDVIFYDTQQLTPFAQLQKIHYTRLTDMTWSNDGRLLAASSTDGFCTLVTFEPDELGIPYTKAESEVDESFLNVSGCEELDKNVDTNSKDDKRKKGSFLIQWANKTKEESGKCGNINCTESIREEECKENKNSVQPTTIETIEILDSPRKDEKPMKKGPPRRIVPIQLSSPGDSSRRKHTPARRKGKTSDNNQLPDAKTNTLIKFMKGVSKACEANVNISEESSNARDAWHEEVKRTETVIVDDDMTESIPDFKLQLENSIVSPPKSQDSNNAKNCIEVSVEKREDNTTVTTMNSKIKAAKCPDKNSVLLQTQSKADLKSSEDTVKKTPRRVQLITLTSSPKHERRNTKM